MDKQWEIEDDRLRFWVVGGKDKPFEMRMVQEWDISEDHWRGWKSIETFLELAGLAIVDIETGVRI